MKTIPWLWLNVAPICLCVLGQNNPQIVCNTTDLSPKWLYLDHSVYNLYQSRRAVRTPRCNKADLASNIHLFHSIGHIDYISYWNTPLCLSEIIPMFLPVLVRRHKQHGANAWLQTNLEASAFGMYLEWGVERYSIFLTLFLSMCEKRKTFLDFFGEWKMSSPPPSKSYIWDD